MPMEMSRGRRLLRRALLEWSDNCPGAGFEHHDLLAYLSLLRTPAMQELLKLLDEATPLPMFPDADDMTQVPIHDREGEV